LTKTESQGFAYQEILSMDKPCFVIDKNIWDYYGEKFAVSASSVPYFDTTCGVVSTDIIKFESFYSKLNEYTPRKYVLNNLTLVKQAEEYIKYLKG